ncbi:unnamed protein product [Meloidogyne enterolobii]|uniref:Uncharacterized protein n=1 Tax=Meloidogyne enterolobii TaxID=390850 RepID=A0ACB0Y6J2_MELEN
MPGLLSATQEWFRVYKIPTGKPENKFAFNGEFKDKEFAHKVIEETNEFWKSLIASNETGGLNTLVYFLNYLIIKSELIRSISNRLHCQFKICF